MLEYFDLILSILFAEFLKGEGEGWWDIWKKESMQDSFKLRSSER
jgi:hypothetical protein